MTRIRPIQPSLACDLPIRAFRGALDLPDRRFLPGAYEGHFGLTPYRVTFVFRCFHVAIMPQKDISLYKTK